MSGKYKEFLIETSLSRVLKHMAQHDTGTITAFRYATECGDGEPYTKKQNLQRNKSLIAKLRNLRYNVTSIKGNYIENYGSKDPKNPPREVGENVFFVVDAEDKGNLFKDLTKLGEEFDQDSILFIPKGGKNSTLYGTNKCDSDLGYHKKLVFSKRVLGQDGQFISRVNGRPFIFKEGNSVIEEHIAPQGYFGRLNSYTIATLHWSKLDVD